MKSTVAYLAAQEHVNDLIREASRNPSDAEIRPRRPIVLTLPRLLTRRLRSVYRPDAANAARARV